MTANTEPPQPPRRDPLLLAWGVTLLVLLGATWPLWTPRELPPRLPAFGVESPPPLEAAALAVIAGALLAALLEGKRWGVGFATAALAALMLGDQLRWQPWAYHALITGAVLWSADRATARGALRAVAIAVYGWSALAKLDAEFAATLGSQLVGVVLPGAGPDMRFALAWLLPAFELAVAVLLAASVWRRGWSPWACGAAVALHAATVLMLSPIGLGHGAGVLLWNAGFALQVVILFRPDRAADPRRPVWRWPLLTLAATALAVAAPALTPLGRWDAWPGWALYAPRLERATLFVRDSAVDRLPATLRRHVGPMVESGVWRPVDLGQWMLEETHAPIYPSNRVAAAMAAELVDSRPLGDGLAVLIEAPAGLLTRERKSRWVDSPEGFRAAARWFNRASTGAAAERLPPPN
ncbi:hypothetical protein [Botrimarina sp.]|uniref:hypothetical protein n=1 Tax=Botrimarina sp. TaxID=2795802 RepID=UPI0032EDFDF5